MRGWSHSMPTVRMTLSRIQRCSCHPFIRRSTGIAMAAPPFGARVGTGRPPVSGGLLDRAELPEVGPDRASEGPVLLELHGLGAAPLDDLLAGAAHRGVEGAGGERDRHARTAGGRPG